MESTPGQTQAVIADLVARDRGRLLSALIAALGDFQLAEDSLQDALAAALVHWGRSDIPANPQGWLLRVARRKAIDRLRRAAKLREKTAEIARLTEADETLAELPEIPDDRLRLIFTCCHPALAPKTRVALTLRTIGGLTTGEIARAFLDRETAMAQRLSRARAKIRAAGIPFAIPGPELWAERLNSVLTVIYLIYNEGYSAEEGDSPVRAGLCEEAIYLGRLVDRLHPGEAETEGLLALMLLSHARWNARRDPAGLPVPTEAQDRARWDPVMIADGLALLDRAMARGAAGPFQIKAAINALHVEAESRTGPDWPQIVLLYDRLLQLEPSPVVALNRAVALAETGRAEAALKALAPLGEALAGYQPYHAAAAEILARLGRDAEAREAYGRAMELSSNAADETYLRHRRDLL